MYKFLVLIVFVVFPVNLFCQQENIFGLYHKANMKIVLDSAIYGDGYIEPFNAQKTISGLAFSGEVTLYSDSSLVRIILIDSNYNEYLIYETYTLLAGSKQFSVEECGEETALLNNINPYRVAFELIDAAIYFKEIIISEAESYQPGIKGARVLEQINYKIDRINQNIQGLGQLWVAGETSISRLSYQEKKSMFGEKVPNFQGFEHYVGGVFVLPGTKNEYSEARKNRSVNLSEAETPFALEFSWRNRHGEDWLTPVKSQGCRDCWAFGTTAAAELLVNLFFNRHLDYDLSEQNLISCTQGSCKGGWHDVALNYMKVNGIVSEDYFPYCASDLDCSEMGCNPPEQIKISAWKNVLKKDERKRAIIKGPAAATILVWKHLLQFVGYRTIEEGDVFFAKTDVGQSRITIKHEDPLIGRTAWQMKNSWGEDWGDNGYAYLICDSKELVFHSLFGPVCSMNFNEKDILCTDNDGDGYYSWGIGPKPSHCPPCPDEADGDDSDKCIGPMDEYGNLTYFTPSPESKDTIILYGQPIPPLCAAGINILWYNDRFTQNLVQTGNCLYTGKSEIGKYTYYVTQTLSSCASAAKKISLSIVKGIPPPVGYDTVIYEGEPAILSAEGEPGAAFKWYEDPLLMHLLHTGDSFETAKSDTGVYIYYVTQEVCTIESAPDTVMLVIHDPFIAIPDKTFLHALIGLGIDINRDSLISYTEARDVTRLSISNEINGSAEEQSKDCKGIKEMKGIEAFFNLEVLKIIGTSVENLSLLNQTRLNYLDCSFNNLKQLDISNCKALDELICKGNYLTKLDISGNSNLIALQCGENEIWRLDVSNNPGLEILSCPQNEMANLDISNNTLLQNLDISGMSTLREVCVWSDPFPPSGVSIDTTGNPKLYFTSDCFYDKYLYIPDSKFRNALHSIVDANGDRLISYSEAESGGYLNLDELGIADLTGIEAFANLKTLRCSHNQLANLDLRYNLALHTVYCFDNRIDHLDVSRNSSLKLLRCQSNKLTKIDISNNAELTELSCSYNPIELLDVSNNNELETLSSRGNQLSSLDISNNPSLRVLMCDNNQIEILDVSNCMYLLQLMVWKNRLSSLDVSNNVEISYLNFEENSISSLDISKNQELTQLWCGDNNLNSLDISNNMKLERLCCALNQISTLNLCNNPSLVYLKINDIPALDTVYVCPSFYQADVDVISYGSPYVYFDTNSCTVGIEKYINTALSIYPNPTSNFLSIETDRAVCRGRSIEIISLSGQLIYKNEMEGSTKQIDMSQFEKGIYFVTVRSKEFVRTEKVVKL